jgi:hypothetical protein
VPITTNVESSNPAHGEVYSITLSDDVCQVLAANRWLYLLTVWVMVRVMVFNATFNNISVISWVSVLSVKETGENH